MAHVTDDKRTELAARLLKVLPNSMSINIKALTGTPMRIPRSGNEAIIAIGKHDDHLSTPIEKSNSPQIFEDLCAIILDRIEDEAHLVQAVLKQRRGHETKQPETDFAPITEEIVQKLLRYILEISGISADTAQAFQELKALNKSSENPIEIGIQKDHMRAGDLNLCIFASAQRVLEERTAALNTTPSPNSKKLGCLFAVLAALNTVKRHAPHVQKPRNPTP